MAGDLELEGREVQVRALDARSTAVRLGHGASVRDLKAALRSSTAPPVQAWRAAALLCGWTPRRRRRLLGNPGAPSDPAVRFCRHSTACSLDPPMHQRGARADRHLQGGSCPAPPPTLPSPLQSATEVFDVLSDRPHPSSRRRRTSWWRR
jgi:hypothetical protein